jgi:hypothetical protein
VDQKTTKSVKPEKTTTGFEKLWIWQKAHKLMQEIHKFCKTLPGEEKFRIKEIKSSVRLLPFVITFPKAIHLIIIRIKLKDFIRQEKKLAKHRIICVN